MENCPKAEGMWTVSLNLVINPGPRRWTLSAVLAKLSVDLVPAVTTRENSEDQESEDHRLPSTGAITAVFRRYLGPPEQLRLGCLHLQVPTSRTLGLAEDNPANLLEQEENQEMTTQSFVAAPGPPLRKNGIEAVFASSLPCLDPPMGQPLV
ncbi:glutathione S-transferase C-terminal domain-containing protein [Lates japonicus]|uniref:Glutathione S-transferase C-terminal domain-containing protein n=1 Tax=Lates japonicus TaxID=270547 RepID=A0AAD3NMT9_LATJO|nr:glutathione S-transferase C-terminal domain-containing protein [Lates japonicus]